MVLKVKYSDGMEPISAAHDGEWIDLRAAERKTYYADEVVQISLGVAIELPEGYEAFVRPRSSMCRKKGLVFADSGVIDHAYCGDGDVWGSTWYAVRPGVVEKNERIAQFRIQPVQPRLDIMAVDHLGNPDRGGYGSTGAM